MKKMSKHERALLRSVKRSFARVASEVKKFIKAGVGENVAVGSTWSLSSETFVHASLTDGKLSLKIVVADLMMTDLKRGARRPGIRDVEVIALDRFAEVGPEMVVERFALALREVLGCGDPHEEVHQVLVDSKVLSWSRSGDKIR